MIVFLHVNIAWKKLQVSFSKFVWHVCSLILWWFLCRTHVKLLSRQNNPPPPLPQPKTQAWLRLVITWQCFLYCFVKKLTVRFYETAKNLCALWIHKRMFRTSGLMFRDPSSILKFRLAPIFLSKISRLILSKN
jgi:hypothetical protein